MYVKIVSVSSKKIRFIHDNHINKFFIYYFGKEVRAQEFLEGVYNLNYLIPGFEILNIKYLLKRIKTVNVLKLKLHKNKTKFNLFSEIINSSINLISKKKIKFPLPISKREFYIINTLLLEMNRLNKLKGVVVSQTVGGMERFIVEATSSKLFKIEISHGFPGFLGLHDPIPVNYYSQYQSLSKLLIYGRGDEKFYIENFKVIRKSQLVKVGNPIFDNYLNQKSSVNVEGYLILLILQPNDTGLDRINLNVKYFLEVIKKFNLNGVIKCHQRQDEDELRYVKHLINIADKNKSVRVLFDLDYLELQSKKLIILSPDSTYSLELLFFKKIIVFLDMGNQKRNIRLDKFNYAVSIENISELIIEIEFILKNYDSYLKQRLANWEITAKYFTSYKDEIDFTFSKAMLEVLANL